MDIGIAYSDLYMLEGQRDIPFRFSNTGNFGRGCASPDGLNPRRTARVNTDEQVYQNADRLQSFYIDFYDTAIHGKLEKVTIRNKTFTALPNIESFLISRYGTDWAKPMRSLHGGVSLLRDIRSATQQFSVGSDGLTVQV